MSNTRYEFKEELLIDDLIVHLQKAKEKLGNVPVLIFDSHCNTLNIETIELFKYAHPAVVLS